jgi:hypothetical protein
MRRLLGSGIVAVAALLVLGGAGVANDPPLIAQVRAAWKERQEKVRTAKFVWKQTVFTAKGGDFEARTGPDGKFIPAAPPEDHSYSSDCTLTIDGDRVVYQFTRRFWDHEKQTYYDVPTEYKFDGSKQLSLNRPRTNGVQQWPDALIRAEPRGAVLPWDTRPVLRTLRGTNPNVRADDLDEYTPTGAVLSLGTGRGRDLMIKGAPTRSERHLWVDPARGYITLRDTSGPAAQPYWQIDVSYKPDATVGWVPSGWKVVNASMVDGRVKATWTATVTSYRLNEPVDEAAFTFTLPAGTWVTDETSRPQEYITKDDGSKRVISRSEIGKTYQELVSTPGPASEGSWWRWRAGLLLAAFVGAGCVLLGVRVWLSRGAAGRRSDSAPGSAPGTSGSGA